MRLSQFLRLPSKFIENENILFSDNESSDLINLYESFNNQQLSRQQKINKMLEILRILESSIGEERKKIICLLMFSVLQTVFGRSIIQSSNRFRMAVLGRYEHFMTNTDEIFVEAIYELRI